MVTRRQVDDPDVRAMVAGAPGAGEALAAADTLREDNEVEVKVRLHDLVDGTTTMPINAQKAQDFHLRKVVYACSACMWTSTWERDFQTHVQQSQRDHKAHARARVVSAQTVNGMGYRCTGCSSVFATPQRAYMHMDGHKHRTDGHENAKVVMKRRFGLETGAPNGQH